MSAVNRNIEMTIAEQDFTFNLTPADVTKYFNAMTQNNKIAPAHNLLIGTVSAEQKEALKVLLANPVHTLSIAGTLLEEYAPDLGAVVKKPSTTLKG